MATDYSGFRVLVDDAAENPRLGFHDYATALAEIIRDSKAEFAVGIFGTWGSGKTTLMREIERILAPRPDIVTAWFTAWRYEKEPHLVVPLIDVLREALEALAGSEVHPAGPARKAADAMKKAGRAFLAGLSVSAGVPGAGATVDVDKVLTTFEEQDTGRPDPLSFYHSAFLLLRQAIAEFSGGGARRVVVFVDDLDRCFPANALQVLESMKLFFEVQGIVFVVGLDQAVAERAVALKYDDQSGTAGTRAPVSGVDYLKKIFQVPFALPRVGTDLLEEYLWALESSPEFGPDQRQDFTEHVRRHLVFLPDQDSVNPREVKRLINTYVVQVKMLQARLGDAMDPNVVMCLQCMNFRPDWRELYESLAADPPLFQRAVSDAIDNPEVPGELWLAGRKLTLSSQFVEYIRGIARPLLSEPGLRSYVSASESTHTTDPALLEAQALLNRLRASLEPGADGRLPTSAMGALESEVPRLASMLERRTDQPGLQRATKDVMRYFDDLRRPPHGDETTQAAAESSQRLTGAIEALDHELRDVRRHASLGAYG